MTLDDIARELRFALRGLRRTPGFTSAAVLTLALAIGANTAVFSVVNAVLLRPLPYREADRIVVIQVSRTFAGAPRPVTTTFSLDQAAVWREALRTAAPLAWYATTAFQLTTAEGSELVAGAHVSPSFFAALEGPFAAGRPLTPADDMTPAVVISERLARRRFGGVREAIGARPVLNAEPRLVVGVAGSRWDVPAATADVWAPTGYGRATSARCCAVQLVARLAPQATLASARADVRAAAAAIAAADRGRLGGMVTEVRPLRDSMLGDGKRVLLVLWAAIGVVLIVACANVLNLLIARNAARARELAVRLALGAPRSRLLAQGLAEAALLAGGGVVGGLVLSRFLIGMVARSQSTALPSLTDASLDARVMAFAAGLGAVSTLVAGILPMLHPAAAIAGNANMRRPTRERRRLQQALCAAQLGAALVLVVAATLFGRSLAGLLHTDLGVAPDHVLTASLNLALGRPHTDVEIVSTFSRIVDRVERLPGIRSAGFGTALPPDASRIRLSLRRAGDAVDYLASGVTASPRYFQALGLRLIAGRPFSDGDDDRHVPVMIMGASTARRFFGDRDPIGQTLRLPVLRNSGLGADRGSNAEDMRLVGVVADVKYSGIDAAAGDQVYRPLAQQPFLSGFLVVRTVANPADAAEEIRKAVAAIDPTVAVSSVRPLDEVVASAVAPPRLRVMLLGSFALLGLIIAATGLYGLIAYSVSQRTQELGIRIAIGAPAREVIRIVVTEAAAIGLAGAALGFPLAYGASRTFAALLYGVTPADPVTYGAAAAVLMAVGMAASFVPARRATRVDPVVALRCE